MWRKNKRNFNKVKRVGNFAIFCLAGDFIPGYAQHKGAIFIFHNSTSVLDYSCAEYIVVYLKTNANPGVCRLYAATNTR